MFSQNSGDKDKNSLFFLHFVWDKGEYNEITESSVLFQGFCKSETLLSLSWIELWLLNIIF